MKRMQALCVLLAILLLPACAPKQWTLRDGVLTVSIDGPMSDYPPDGKIPPWFTNAGEITSIVIGDSVTRVGEMAFCLCVNAQSASVGAGVAEIGVGAFAGCSSLEEISLPDGLTRIEKMAFDGCGKLESVAIPDSVTEIGEGAFAHTPLNAVEIPDSVTEIGEHAFFGCKNLESASVPAGAEIAPNAFPETTAVTRREA